MPFTCGGCALTFRSRNTRDTHFDATGHRAPAHECPAPTCMTVEASDLQLWEHMQGCARLKRTKFRGVPWADVYTFCENCERLFCGSTALEDVS